MTNNGVRKRELHYLYSLPKTGEVPAIRGAAVILGFNELKIPERFILKNWGLRRAYVLFLALPATAWH